MIEPTYPWPGAPVVRCTLRCVYCAATFVRDFDRHGDIQGLLFACSIPAPIANIRRLKVIHQRTWYGRRYTETVEERVAVACPHCGANSQLISRQPIGGA